MKAASSRVTAFMNVMDVVDGNGSIVPARFHKHAIAVACLQLHPTAKSCWSICQNACPQYSFCFSEVSRLTVTSSACTSNLPCRPLQKHWLQLIRAASCFQCGHLWQKTAKPFCPESKCKPFYTSCPTATLHKGVLVSVTSTHEAPVTHVYFQSSNSRFLSLGFRKHYEQV